MPNDYAKATSAPRTLTLAGQDYRIAKLRPRDLGELDAWLKEQVPNPKAEARKLMEGLSDAVAIHVWNQAVADARDWPPTTETPAGNKVLSSSTEGQARLVWVILRRTVAGMTLEEARDVSETLSVEDFDALCRYASPGDPDDPKSGAAAGATETSTTNEPAPNSPSPTGGPSA